MNNNLSQEIRHDLKKYIDENYIGTIEICEAQSLAPVDQLLFQELDMKFGDVLSSEEVTKGVRFDDSKMAARSLDELVDEVSESFHEMLFRKIDTSGMTDVEVYKRAGIDRKLFSKIRSNPDYHPKKTTVLALAIALKLNLDETIDLLSRAEYALSPGNKMDVVIKYFIEHEIYDIDTINSALYEYELPLLE